MKKVSVITGGASGMGYAAAECLGRDNEVLISDINAEKLEESVNLLRGKGIKASGEVCNVSDREQVRKLAQTAAGLGEIASVVHAAGIAPGKIRPGWFLQ